MVRRQASVTGQAPGPGLAHHVAGSLSALATPLPQHGAGVLVAHPPALASSAIRVPVRGTDAQPERRRLVSPARGAIAASLGATAVHRVKDRFVPLPLQDGSYRVDEVDHENDSDSSKQAPPGFDPDQPLATMGPIAAAAAKAAAAAGEWRGRITVLCVAEELDLEQLEADLGATPDPTVLRCEAHPEVLYVQTTHSARGGPADVFFFDYGVVACWGLTPEQEQDVVTRLARPYQHAPLSTASAQTDFFEFHYSANEPPHINNDIITINRRQAADHRVKLAISHALAQCAKLTVCEERVMDLVGEVRHLPEAMAEFGEVRMSRKQVAQLMGKVFLQKSAVNLLSSVLDTPEYFWRQPDSLQALYERSCEYLDLEGRIELVNSRFEVLQNMLDIWRDHANHTHIARLDGVIIWLVVLEVLLAAAQVFGYINTKLF